MRRRQDFAAAVRRGRRAGSSTVVVHLRLDRSDDSTPEISRVGFVVSKAVGGAVERNHVKRRLRHLVRSRLDQLPTGALVVVRALPMSAGASVEELARDLDASLERLLRIRPAGSAA